MNYTNILVLSWIICWKITWKIHVQVVCTTLSVWLTGPLTNDIDAASVFIPSFSLCKIISCAMISFYGIGLCQHYQIQDLCYQCGTKGCGCQSDHSNVYSKSCKMIWFCYTKHNITSKHPYYNIERNTSTDFCNSVLHFTAYRPFKCDILLKMRVQGTWFFTFCLPIEESEAWRRTSVDSLEARAGDGIRWRRKRIGWMKNEGV